MGSLHSYSCHQQCDGGWGTRHCMWPGMKLWDISVTSTLMIPNNTRYANNTRVSYLAMWYYIYVTETMCLFISEKLWKWWWGSSAKKSHSSEEKQHILVPLAFHGQGIEQSFILAEKAVLTADLDFSLNPCYDASHFSNNTNNWIMLLNIYWAF